MNWNGRLVMQACCCASKLAGHSTKHTSPVPFCSISYMVVVPPVAGNIEACDGDVAPGLPDACFSFEELLELLAPRREVPFSHHEDEQPTQNW